MHYMITTRVLYLILLYYLIGYVYGWTVGHFELLEMMTIQLNSRVAESPCLCCFYVNFKAVVQGLSIYVLLSITIANEKRMGDYFSNVLSYMIII